MKFCGTWTFKQKSTKFKKSKEIRNHFEDTSKTDLVNKSYFFFLISRWTRDEEKKIAKVQVYWMNCPADKLQQTTKLKWNIEVWWETLDEMIFNWVFMHELIKLINNLQIMNWTNFDNLLFVWLMYRNTSRLIWMKLMCSKTPLKI